MTSLVNVSLAAKHAPLLAACMTSLKELPLEVEHVIHELVDDVVDDDSSEMTSAAASATASSKSPVRKKKARLVLQYMCKQLTV